MSTPRSVSDPENVKKLVNIDVGGSPAHDSELIVVGARAIVTLFDGLAVVDFSDPANAKKARRVLHPWVWALSLQPGVSTRINTGWGVLSSLPTAATPS
mmetsp:Transcript_34863/g.87662  ORF Transcript_34863/g.87662 Transcript_34863/m.87662 type:complete len:99 (-) Transcript_34863:589-885(-)